jgi:hypothetical protein
MLRGDRAQGEREMKELPRFSGRPWTQDDDDKLRALAIAGASSRAIGVQMNRTELAVRSRAGRLILSLGNQNPPSGARRWAEAEGETMSVRRRCLLFGGNLVPARTPEPPRSRSSARPTSPSRPAHTPRQPEPSRQQSMADEAIERKPLLRPSEKPGMRPDESKPRRR